jgi:hypothetical protein
MRAYKFNPQTTTPQPNILNNKSEIEFLKEMYQRGWISGLDNLLNYGVYKLLGWQFSFDCMKRFVVKQHGNIQEYYAPNKTMLRKVLYGRIYYILEVK